MSKAAIKSAISLITLASASCSQPSLFTTLEHPNDDTFIVSNVNVIPMSDEMVLENQFVLVRNGRIEQIGPEVEMILPGDYYLIDGQDGYLVPGLADMHVHLGLKLPEDGDPSQREMQRDLSLYLPHGVTLIRHMRGDETALELKAAIEDKEIAGPRLIVASPSLTTDRPTSFGPNVTSPEQARDIVTELASKGYDLIKVHQDLDDATFDAVITAASELGLPVSGHAQDNLDDTLSYSSLEHTEELSHLLGADEDFSDHPEILNDIRESGITLTPTLVVFDTIHKYLSDDGLNTLLASDDVTYASSYWRDAMSREKNYFRQAFGPGYAAEEPYFRTESERLGKLTRQIKDVGIPLMLGTDAVGLVVPGVSVHQELELLVEAGLSPYEALETATIVPADWLGESRSRGQIAVGMDADFVLIEKNPLENISATRSVLGVMTDGEWYSQKALQEMLPALPET